MIPPAMYELDKANDELLNRRSAITISNITQLIYSSMDGKLSFRHIWNHILVMLQHPLSFFIYRKLKGKKKYEHYYTLNKDPLSIERFEEIKEKYLSTQTDIKKYIFPIVTSNDCEYYIVLISAYNFTAVDQARVRCLEPIVNKSDEFEEDSCFRYLLPVQRQAYNFFHGKHATRTIFFDEFLLKSLDSIEEKKTNRSKSKNTYATKPSVYEYQFNRLLFQQDTISSLRSIIKSNKFKNNRNDASKGYINRVYKKIRSGLSFIQSLDSGAYVSNALFYVVDYLKSDNLPRCGDGYNYNVKLYLHDEQKDQFKRYLDNLKKASTKLPYSALSGNSDKDSVVYNLLARADDWFWMCVKEKRYDEIIEIITSPFGPSLRSVADATISNGSVHFMYGFLNDGGIARCFGGAVDQEVYDVDESSPIWKEILRQCVAYYLFRAIMPDKDRNLLDEDFLRARNITLIMVPIEVQGCIPMVCAHFLFLTKSENESDIDWHKSVDIYNAIDQKIKRSLRKTYKELYINVIRDVFYENLTAVLLKSYNSIEEKNTLLEVEGLLNKDLDILEPFIPFKIAKVYLYYTDEYIKKNGINTMHSISRVRNYLAVSEVHSVPVLEVISGAIEGVVTLRENSCFSQKDFSGREFLGSGEIVSEFAREVNRAFTSYSLGLRSRYTRED